jgi:hypothetical protein
MDVDMERSLDQRPVVSIIQHGGKPQMKLFSERITSRYARTLATQNAMQCATTPHRHHGESLRATSFGLAWFFAKAISRA